MWHATFAPNTALAADIRLTRVAVVKSLQICVDDRDRSLRCNVSSERQVLWSDQISDLGGILSEGDDWHVSASWLGMVVLVVTAISPLCAPAGVLSPVASPVYTLVALALLCGVFSDCVLCKTTRKARLWVNCLFIALLYFAEAVVLTSWALLDSPSYEGIFRRYIEVMQAPVLGLASFAAGRLMASAPRGAQKRGEDSSGVGDAPCAAILLVAAALGYLPRLLWMLLDWSASCSVALAAGVAACYLFATLSMVRISQGYPIPLSQIACGYALGMLLWALLTRVCPVCSDIMLALVPFVVCALFAVAAVFIGSLGRFLRAGEAPEQQGGVFPAEFADADLSDRELQLAQLAYFGKTSARIAAELGISASTVRVTLGKVYKKLGVEGLEGLRELARPAAEAPNDPAKKPWEKLGTGRVGLIFLAFPVLPVAVASSEWGQGQPLLLGAALALLAYGALSIVSRDDGAPELRGPAAGAACAVVAAAGLTLLVAVPVAGVASGEEPGAVAAWLEFPCAFLYVGGLLTLFGRRGGSEPHVWAPALLLAFFLGLLLEEMWRSTTSFSVLSSLLPLAAMMGWFAWRLLTEDARRRWLGAAVGVAAMTLGALGIAKLWVAVAVLLLPVSILINQKREARLLFGPTCFAALAYGILVGVVGVSYGEDGAIALSALSTAVLFGTSQAMLCLRLVVLALSGLGAAAAYAIYAHFCRLGDLGREPSRDERLRGFLVSRGLNEVESRTAVLIAQGKTTPQIAEVLHYSPGMINTARRSAYAKLDVKGANGLIALFSQFTGQ